MLSVAEARARMLACVQRLECESAPLADAAVRVLARAIVAHRDQPPFASSSMDGYALRASNTPGRLALVGESAAGRGFAGAIGAGQCVRISTGAPMPEGADAVAIQEDVARDGEAIVAPTTPVGQHIRPRGCDFAAGSTLLDAGRTLDAEALTLAAAAGEAALEVVRKPRVIILSGGDEIALPGTPAGPHQVYDSTRYGVAAMIAARGGAPSLAAPLPDDRVRTTEALVRALGDADMVVMLGGASVGDHDHARAAAMALDAEMIVEKVAVRPGKPTWFARCGGSHVLGLPGNPASALVTARLFLAPLLAAMLGSDTAAVVATTRARLTHDLSANGPREHYLRARLVVGADGVCRVTAFGNQDSSLMSVAAASDALLVRPANDAAKRADDLVDILRF